LEYEFENLSQMKKKNFLPQTYMNYSTSTFQTANKTSQSALQTSNKTMTNFGESSKLNVIFFFKIKKNNIQQQTKKRPHPN